MPSGPRPEPPTRFCKLVYHGSFDDAAWTNVMWLFLTGSGEITTANLNDLADACSAAYSDNLLPLASTHVTLSDTQVVLYAGGGDVIEGVASVGGTGVQTGTYLPANCAVCLSWQIAPHYRGGHPRTYLCGIPYEFVSGSTSINGSGISDYVSAGNAFHADLEAITGVGSGISTVEHGVASFVRDGAWRTPPVFYRIVGCAVDSRLDSQRRRLGSDR